MKNMQMVEYIICDGIFYPIHHLFQFIPLNFHMAGHLVSYSRKSKQRIPPPCPTWRQRWRPCWCGRRSAQRIWTVTTWRYSPRGLPMNCTRNARRRWRITRGNWRRLRSWERKLTYLGSRYTYIQIGDEWVGWNEISRSQKEMWSWFSQRESRF